MKCVLRLCSVSTVLVLSLTSAYAAAPVAEVSEHWGPSPLTFKYSLGYERSLDMANPGANGMIGTFPFNNLVLGYWLGEKLGFDANIGFSKAGDTFTQTSTVTGATTTQQEVLSYAGQRSPMNYFIGTTVKCRVFQNEWFHAYAGWMVGLSPGTSTDENTGTTTRDVTTGNIGESGAGNIKRERSVIFTTGPKLGAQFYPKWFPHVALGFASGVAFQFGGNSTTTTTTEDKTQAGVVSNQRTVVSSNDLRSQVGTFGIGGQQFSLLGIFNVRYEF